MHSYPSRSEKRETKLYAAAEKGHLALENEILYPSEIKFLKKKGFRIFNVKPSGIKSSLYNATIVWATAYPCNVPHMVQSYINHTIDTFPDYYIENLAQKLYVISKRESNKK